LFEALTAAEPKPLNGALQTYDAPDGEAWVAAAGLVSNTIAISTATGPRYHLARRDLRSATVCATRSVTATDYK